MSLLPFALGFVVLIIVAASAVWGYGRWKETHATDATAAADTAPPPSTEDSSTTTPQQQPIARVPQPQQQQPIARVPQPSSSSLSPAQPFASIGGSRKSPATISASTPATISASTPASSSAAPAATVRPPRATASTSTTAPSSSIPNHRVGVTASTAPTASPVSKPAAAAPRAAVSAPPRVPPTTPGPKTPPQPAPQKGGLVGSTPQSALFAAQLEAESKGGLATLANFGLTSGLPPAVGYMPYGRVPPKLKAGFATPLSWPTVADGVPKSIADRKGRSVTPFEGAYACSALPKCTGFTYNPAKLSVELYDWTSDQMAAIQTDPDLLPGAYACGGAENVFLRTDPTSSAIGIYGGREQFQYCEGVAYTGDQTFTGVPSCPATCADHGHAYYQQRYTKNGEPTECACWSSFLGVPGVACPDDQVCPVPGRNAGVTPHWTVGADVSYTIPPPDAAASRGSSLLTVRQYQTIPVIGNRCEIPGFYDSGYSVVATAISGTPVSFCVSTREQPYPMTDETGNQIIFLAANRPCPAGTTYIDWIPDYKTSGGISYGISVCKAPPGDLEKLSGNNRLIPFGNSYQSCTGLNGGWFVNYTPVSENEQTPPKPGAPYGMTFCATPGGGWHFSGH